MGRGYFHEARAEARIDVEVGEDGDLAVDDGRRTFAPTNLSCRGPFGDRHAGVAEHPGDMMWWRPRCIPAHRQARRADSADTTGGRLLSLYSARRRRWPSCNAGTSSRCACRGKSARHGTSRKKTLHRSGVVGIHGEVSDGEVDGAAHALDSFRQCARRTRGVQSQQASTNFTADGRRFPRTRAFCPPSSAWRCPHGRCPRSSGWRRACGSCG